jgi:bifunctional non-homologous end joining protein LigD
MARELPGIKAAPFPGFIEPALATLAGKVPSGERWVHEIKFDGYRLQLHAGDGGIKFYTRRGHDWSKRFANLAEAAWNLKTHGTIIDGEVIVPTESGLSDFGALESDLGAGRCGRFVFHAFDLLYLDGYDLRGAGLVDRKKVLGELIADSEGPLQISEHLEVEGPEMYRNACALKLEGVVSKVRDGPYRSGRTNNWVKVTCRKRDTFVVVGVATKGKKFDGVYLGREEKGKLVYAGKVEHGFSDTSAKDLQKRLKPFITGKQAFAKKISKPKATWYEPSVLVDVEYRALTGEGKLRHPSFKGVREDLS